MFSDFILPPGAINPKLFLENCTKCYECISICPHEALRAYRENTDSPWTGLPVIIPRLQACYHCDDFPCIQVCEKSALHIEFKDRRHGTAIINYDSCIAWQGYFCQTCISNCPPEYNAIKLNEKNMPEINADECTGCGLCVQVCPADPQAINIKLNND